ncbi:hypothetical protein MTO96_009398 [Rhipicephalus appendiculatus]
MVSLTASESRTFSEHVTLTPWIFPQQTVCVSAIKDRLHRCHDALNGEDGVDCGSIRARVGLWPIACARTTVVWEPAVGTGRDHPCEDACEVVAEPISSVVPHQSRPLFRSSRADPRPDDEDARWRHPPPFGALIFRIRGLMAAIRLYA